MRKSRTLIHPYMFEMPSETTWSLQAWYINPDRVWNPVRVVYFIFM
ncbi:hypothetical protein KsCSTR_00640 [Candidatus Kuenenia stuttgartiensis]|uniref:Uncharacterized protein n=1 Tax=Kuenenia stuttgartiensis TaxID=174633 RepID=A0A6G7GJF9_KUEST|nr:hypothetical protein KsCSTR_00640 [Candidatus Kuenenia stuttgartiensis]